MMALRISKRIASRVIQSETRRLSTWCDLHMRSRGQEPRRPCPAAAEGGHGAPTYLLTDNERTVTTGRVARGAGAASGGGGGGSAL
jgi:hypothetical protein